MASAKKTWVSILIAAVIIVGIIAIVVVGSTAFFVYSHVRAQVTPQATAEQQFADARARFAGQQPLIELSPGDEPVLHRDASRPRRAVQALHALVYDAHARKLTHVDIPGWLLRVMSAGGHFRLANLDMFEDDQSQLTLEDLERHGPGLILDVRRGRGSQVLLWTE
jgi:hypothetical protein